MANNKPLWRKCNRSSRFVLRLNGLELGAIERMSQCLFYVKPSLATDGDGNLFESITLDSAKEYAFSWLKSYYDKRQKELTSQLKKCRSVNTLINKVHHARNGKKE